MPRWLVPSWPGVWTAGGWGQDGLSRSLGCTRCPALHLAHSGTQYGIRRNKPHAAGLHISVESTVLWGTGRDGCLTSEMKTREPVGPGGGRAALEPAVWSSSLLLSDSEAPAAPGRNGLCTGFG